MIYRNHLVLEKLLHLQVRENYYGDLICDPPKFTGASQVVLVVKKPPARARDIRDTGSVLGSGRSPGGGMATHSSILAWRIPWTREPGGLQSMGSQGVGHDRSDLAPTARVRDVRDW